MISSLDDLNTASREEALAALSSCVGSKKWADALVDARPYADQDSLEETAARSSNELGPDDWIEAVSSHPRIGDRTSAQPSTTGRSSERVSEWASGEQSGTRSASHETLATLAAANAAYEQRFGYIFIVCATGKTSSEMIETCRKRLSNDPATELSVAADELRKIARLRLRKLTRVDELT